LRLRVYFYDGNGVLGDVTVEGGGLYNPGTATLNASSVNRNVASSTVVNGSDNGDGNGDNDNGDGNGDTNGSGVGGDTTVGGGDVTVGCGGIYNADSLSADGLIVSANSAASVVVNGSNNGINNGVVTENSNGNSNGNGVDGSIVVSGAGLVNASTGTATLTYVYVLGNRITSSITNGADSGTGDTTLDGQVVNGTVTVSGANSF
jgi:hypothetical protein